MAWKGRVLSLLPFGTFKIRSQGDSSQFSVPRLPCCCNCAVVEAGQQDNRSAVCQIHIHVDRYNERLSS